LRVATFYDLTGILWQAVGSVVLLFLAGGITFMTSGHVVIADSFYIAGFALLFAKLVTWRRSETMLWGSLTLILLVFSIAGNHKLNQEYPFNNVPPDLGSKIRTWSQDSGAKIVDISDSLPDAFFAYRLELYSGTFMRISQPRKFPSYLLIEASLGITNPEQVQTFLKLTDDQKEDLVRKILTAVNQMKLECAGDTHSMTEMIFIRKTVLVSGETPDSFLSDIQSINSAVGVAESIMQSGLH
jgi:hypothetical protein